MNPLREAMQDYLAMRRELGFKMYEAGLKLPRFIEFLEQRKAPHITVALALEWAQQPTSVLPAERARRLSYVRGFARHHKATDPLTEIPPCGLLPYRPGRAKPYFYSPQEVEGLLAAARGLSPATGLHPWTYSCLFGLLSVSGMRIGEALRLKVSDVDLDRAVLRIEGSKCRRSRLVPIHASTAVALADYLERRALFLAGRPAPNLFISGRGNRLDGADVHRMFYALSRQLGLRALGASCGPRLHDFRHRFAGLTLLHWYQQGQDVERLLPVLSTYLGHIHVANTYWYLDAWPELMTQAMQRLERRWGNAS
ncbi:integrase [Variovorax paradoxus]|jgi:integrase/recombinase XerD|uniref:tyrosine-type recombinase/integrase n=1 Tax=Comamonadaceae TaxID=80864 RepID=UPI0006E60D85|nr:tyrosine-type recombinase/integrase [Xenophilus azovorans]KPU94347.1 integrase [Variovorax paradoxus]KPU99385.1 integrase [Variovorax paradoxus]KPV08745.1 integrase [Variovorax paradoxus]KPV15292.1 integrase [Variovorax paradoxus]KPV33678.1 integrase [Variovorax paradoxus]